MTMRLLVLINVLGFLPALAMQSESLLERPRDAMGPQRPQKRQKRKGHRHSRRNPPGNLSESCDLGFMASRLHLFTMAPTHDYMLMRHFLTHYRDLGVRLHKYGHVVLHVTDDESFGKMQWVLKEFNMWNYNNFEVVDHYHPDIKRDKLNAWLKSLPLNAWAINADDDEFFEYPCNLQESIKKGEGLFWGHMEDRVGSNFSFPVLKEDPSIHEQYPVSCTDLRQTTGDDSATSKYMLFKVHDKGQVRQFKSSHSLVMLQGARSSSQALVQTEMFKLGQDIGGFPHYMFTGLEFLQKFHYKAALYKKASPQQSKVLEGYKELMNFTSGLPVLTAYGRKILAQKCDK